MLIYLIYSLLFIVVWMMSFFQSNLLPINIILGILYTFYSSYMVRRFVSEETVKLKIIKSLGPTFYFVIFFIFIVSIQGINIFSSLAISFYLFVYTLFDKKAFPSKPVQVFVLALSLFYGFYMDSYIRYFSVLQLDDFAKKISEPEPLKPSKTYKLSDFSFINRANDTIQLQNIEKFIALEYWNDVDGAIAAYQSFAQMRSFWASQSNLDYYAIFYPVNLARQIDTHKLYTHPKLQQPENILIESKMLDSLRILNLPAYIIFNAQGEIVFIQDGYSPTSRYAIQNKIQKAIQNK